jgi:hypothetical protein
MQIRDKMSVLLAERWSKGRKGGHDGRSTFNSTK